MVVVPAVVATRRFACRGPGPRGANPTRIVQPSAPSGPLHAFWRIGKSPACLPVTDTDVTSTAPVDVGRSRTGTSDDALPTSVPSGQRTTRGEVS
jgi:hypothetical protein